MLIEKIRKQTINIGPDGTSCKLSKPTSNDAILSVENEFGFKLPELLKEIYSQIGNGGFGPGYGVMGIPGGFTDDQGEDILSLYKSYRKSDPEDDTWAWPKGLVPICHWGCVVYSCVHCLENEIPIYFADIGVKDPGEPMESILIKHKSSFEEWIRAWVDGVDLWAEVYK